MAATILAQLDSRPVPIPDWIDPALGGVIARATAKSCEERYPSVMEALADLEAVQLGAAGEELPPAPVDVAPEPEEVLGEDDDDDDDISWLEAEPEASDPGFRTQSVEVPKASDD